MTYELLTEHGAVQWPFPEGARSAGRRASTRMANFPTADGRAQLCLHRLGAIPRAADRDYPLILNTGRTVEHWHTRTKTGEVPILERLSPRAWLEMNPRDAKSSELRSHDRVDVVSRARPRARRRTAAHRDRRARARSSCRFISRKPTSNQVTQSAFDPISREPNYKQCAVRCENEPERDPWKKLVVVGNGMAGVACVEQILKHPPKFEITIFGDETHVNYNRILLSSVLAGEKHRRRDRHQRSRMVSADHDIGLRLGVRIVGYRPSGSTVTGDDGSVTSYDKLLLATGSSAFIPPIAGVDKKNVFVFRTLDDTRALLAAAARPA